MLCALKSRFFVYEPVKSLLYCVLYVCEIFHIGIANAVYSAAAPFVELLELFFCAV
jgi:hypothetical protein